MNTVGSVESGWHAKWVGRYQGWLPDRSDPSATDALDGITSSPGFQQDRQMLDSLLAMTQDGIRRIHEHADDQSATYQVDDDVYVYVRGDRVLVAKEHEFHPPDQHRYSILNATEFLRFLEFLDKVMEMPKEHDVDPVAPIAIELLPGTADDVTRFIATGRA